MIRQPLDTDDRSVSIAVNHVLTIGITATLLTTLLLGMGGLLDSERERAATESLSTVGERLSGEISSVDRMKNETSDNVTIRSNYQRTVSGSTYTIELLDSGCDGPLVEDVDECLLLSAHQENVDVYVPVKTDTPVENSSVSGGPIKVISHEDDDSITIEPKN